MKHNNKNKNKNNKNISHKNNIHNNNNNNYSKTKNYILSGCLNHPVVRGHVCVTVKTVNYLKKNYLKT